MKTKKILLGCLVLAFAIGSAVASVFAPIKPRVLVYETQIDMLSGFETCVQLNDVLCEDSGVFACVVQIDVDFGGNITDKTYSDGNCSVRLKHIVPNTQVSDDHFYALVEPIN